MVAGIAAGLTSFIDDPGRRRTLSLFLLARALGALVLTLHRRGKLPTVPHFVVLTFGVCQSLIIYATVHYPSLLPTSYYHAILSWSRYFSEEKLRVRLPILKNDHIFHISLSCPLAVFSFSISCFPALLPCPPSGLLSFICY